MGEAKYIYFTCLKLLVKISYPVKTLKKKNNGGGQEIQEDVGEHQLSVGARHEEWQILLGHEADPQVTQTGQGQADHHREQLPTAPQKRDRVLRHVGKDRSPPLQR